MKKLSMLVLASLFAMSAFFALGAASARAADNDLYQTVDYRRLSNMMKDFGYEIAMSSSDVTDIEPYSGEDHIWWFIGDPGRPRIDINDEGRRIEFYVYYTTDNDNLLERTNVWNRDNSYARAHVDDDGDPVLELELDITGGVTEGAIRAFFKQCEASLKSWRADVVD